MTSFSRACLSTAWFAVAGLATTGCSSVVEPSISADAAVAEDPGFATCAVCEMVIQEQAAPRAQLVLRDGSHKHMCSIGDLRAWVQSPGPAGKPVAVFVEVQSVEAQTSATIDTPTRAFGQWLRAEETTFVVGIERPSVMGRPALAFADPKDAATVAERVGGYVASWDALAETSFHLDPPRSAIDGPPPSDPDRK
jgi:nitrous oxide reductase accessory protein NosL